MIGHSYPAKRCGDAGPHAQHVWVRPQDRAYACFGRPCSECGCNVAADHTPGDDHCDALRIERDRGRRG